MATADRLAWRTSSFSGNGGTCVEVAPGTGLAWRTSSYSNNGGTCVEVAPGPGLAWRTSSFSGNGQTCVEVAPGPRLVHVRDTKDHGHGPELPLDPPAFDALCRAAVTGSADEPFVTHAECRTTHAGAEVTTTWHVTHGAGELHFTDAEWAAFAAGVAAGEFAFAPV